MVLDIAVVKKYVKSAAQQNGYPNKVNNQQYIGYYFMTKLSHPYNYTQLFKILEQKAPPPVGGRGFLFLLDSPH